MTPTPEDEQPVGHHPRYGIVLEGRAAQSLRSAYRAYSAASGRYLDKPEAHQEAAERLADVIQAGRAQGWPWQTMGDVCEVSGERLRQVLAKWGASRPAPPTRIPKFPSYPELLAGARAARTAGALPARTHLSAEQRAELAQLGVLAAQNTGGVPVDDPRRRASERFSELIAEYRRRRVTWPELSAATGKTQVALRARAALHGHGSVPPSQEAKRYQGVQALPPPGGGRSDMTNS